MIIKQLTVFLENKSGRLTEVTEILSSANINISALSIAETSEYGILRLIVSDPEVAVKALKENLFSVNLTDVICLCIPNQPGSLMSAIKVLSNANVSVEYMYAFAKGDRAQAIIRCDDSDKAISLFSEHKMELLEESDL
ncbi:amino acid-binding ACT domain-containing protein [Chitinispirillum alkaliphilum]|nr:amino acid-binding ACT domain-containing protein [Chitinispirillum alkaliphilum]